MNEFLKQVAAYAEDLEDFKDFHDLPNENSDKNTTIKFLREEVHSWQIS